ncbi:MAG: ribosome maturation factor RimP [Myxococcales bacterium]|jgi:ribosome maturation factor RimP|nr:ribosome maturation factor RimP [Myxococcales bacterium]
MEIDPKTAAVWAIAEPIALDLGLELVDIELRREGRGTVLRLLIDRRGGGVSLDELTAVSREISDALDVRDDTIPGAYTLEVSSPGINRPLTRPGHFEAFVGKKVHVQTRRELGKRHSFRGILTATRADGITITGDDHIAHDIAYDAIIRANYQHEFPALGQRRSERRSAQRSAHRAGSR